jgi:hypothetical protein
MIGRRIAVLLGVCVLGGQTAEAQSREGCVRTVTTATDRLLAQSAPGMIALGQGPRVVRLLPVCRSSGEDAGILQRVASSPPSRRFLLVVEDLRAGAQPGVLFDVELAPASSRRTAMPEQGALVGTLNFFAAQRPGVVARPRMVSYDVTAALRAMAASGRRSDALALTIRPATPPAPDADAAIGRIALMMR